MLRRNTFVAIFQTSRHVFVWQRLSPPPSTGGFIPEPHGFGVFFGAPLLESFNLTYFRTEVTPLG